MSAHSTSRSRPGGGDGTTSPYLDAALGIAETLVRGARRVPSGLTWDGDDLAGDDERSMVVVRGPVGPSLYGGAAGIGWFLGHLAAFTRDGTLARASREALEHALAEVASIAGPWGVSLMSGATGVALAAVDVGRRLRQPSLRQAGTVLAGRVADAVASGEVDAGENDLIGGLAGVLVGLLAVHHRAASPRLLAACGAVGDRLVERRRAGGFGTSWLDLGAAASAPALCGLGHGVSGIAWALSELAWSAGRMELQPIVDEALRYERGCFSRERCAWADLRAAEPGRDDGRDAVAWTTAWCHGALGIGAARWRLYERGADIAALAEASAAIQAARGLIAQAGWALRQGQVSDVTLCHGLGGAVDLMLIAYEVTGLAEHLRAARRAGDLCLAIRRANGDRWTLGLRGADAVPGLFLGLAGIGAVMLRLHAVTLIGSPLLPGRVAPSRAAARARQNAQRIASRSA